VRHRTGLVKSLEKTLDKAIYKEYIVEQMNRRICTLVADDQEIVTWGLRTLLSRHSWVSRCLQATEPASAVTLARTYRPEVALIGAHWEDVSASELIRRLQGAAPGIKVLIMANGEAASRLMLTASGACGFVSKHWTGDEIVAAIRVAALGMTVSTGWPADAVLTEREGDVLRQIALGATNQEVAQALNISLYTVKQHASAAYRKLHARNRVEAVERARHAGLIDTA
jgi:DNA-binding NarL/FixJ family response regulator